MPYKSLLTIFPIEDDIDVLLPAIELARSFKAHLDIVIVGVLLIPSDYFYGGIADDSWRDHNHEIYKCSEEKSEAIEALVAENQISANVTTELQFKEMTGSALNQYTFCTDLNVLPLEAIQQQGTIIRSYYRSLIDAGKPALLLTKQAFQPQELSNVILAWNGKPEAAKAIHQALPLLRDADHVLLVMVDPEKSELGENPGHDMATFLARHGVTLTVEPITSGGDSITDALLQRATDVNADLMVMGAHGTTRLREWLLGGTTQDILKRAKLPIFLSH